MSSDHPFRSEKTKAEYLAYYDTMAKDWPVTSDSRMVETSYGQTFIRTSGPPTAKPLVLLSGLGSNSLMWIPNIEALSMHFRTYAVDNIYDCGRSVYTRACENAEDFVSWLDELFDALELGDDISLMGMSYGGWLASQYALHFPERLDNMILLAPAATVMRVRLEFFVGLLLCLLPIPYFTRRFIYRGAKDLVRKDPAAAEEAVEHSLIVNRCYKPKRIAAPTVLTDRELRNINVPTLILIGENERIYSAKKAVKRLGNVAPQMKTEIIPYAGHDITVVQAELVNTKVLEFLK
jgi:pimeloyl-ACP methyl ester carboxylesterase